MYQHTQRAPLCLLIYAIGGILVAISMVAEVPFQTNRWFLVAACPIFLLAASFHYLRVEDEGTALAIRFGPIPLFRRSVTYADIRSIETGRTTIIEGWGIHLSPRGGWVWNLWGRDCVVLHLRRSTLRLGTDDVEALARFLEGRMIADARNDTAEP